VPKGYDRVEGKLIVNAEEAVAVRNIFLAYLESGCVRKLAERLKHTGISQQEMDQLYRTSTRRRGFLAWLALSHAQQSDLHRKDCSPGKTSRRTT
jgi:hypothetical protein